MPLVNKRDKRHVFTPKPHFLIWCTDDPSQGERILEVSCFSILYHKEEARRKENFIFVQIYWPLAQRAQST